MALAIILLGGVALIKHPVAPPRGAALRACFVRQASPLHVARVLMCTAEGSPQRMSIKVSAPQPTLAKLAAACRMEGGVKRGLTGIVYGIEAGRIEIVSEGKRVDKFVSWVEKFIEQECVDVAEACEVATVLARDLDSGTKAMYSSAFPVVNFDADARRVRINLRGDKQVLDYTLRHTKIEAGYNRKLTYEGNWIDDQQLELMVEGPARQLKSFVRWCKRGPPLQRPETITIHWGDMPIEDVEPMSTAFRDEGSAL
ncbi:hypothetical protein KFE25_007028 [Diacronema lutheri]|uniref:Acylphosphatase-like domain-containing protein n=1 Tax=Diacronema lutheri TaxID=2081491 RepID=A0A8J6CEB8_DIALT|nr:hypothetical protein KFE25_007028 [Diacronema lutheri]